MPYKSLIALSFSSSSSEAAMAMSQPGIHKLLDKEIEILVNIVSDSRGEEKKQNEGYPLSLKCRCETALAKMW
eukprot:scaffold1149_cov173-Skeletonema_marinoi.AAC.16